MPITEAMIAIEGWQSIESAPKDGSFIWLATKDHMRIGYWYVVTDDPSKEHWADMARAEARGPRDLLFTPTHWRSLPELPVGAA